MAELGLEAWKGCLTAYVDADGNAKKAWKAVKKQVKLPLQDFLDIVYQGDRDKGLPPIHDMFLRSVREAVEEIQVELTQGMVDTMKLTHAYQVVLAKKIKLLEMHPEKVPNNMASELLNVFKVQEGLAKAMQDQGGSLADSMSLSEAQRLAGEARSAMSRAHVEDDEDYGLEGAVKTLEPGGKVIPIK